MAYGSVLTDTVQTSTAATAPVFKDGNGTQIGTLCRAWVNFNGTGTVAIRASFNVSSITDNGTGDYTINYTNALPDANYSLVGTVKYDDTSGGVFQTTLQIARVATPITTTTSRVVTGQTSTAYDCNIVNVAVFR